MTYNPSIPQPTDLISVSQGQILTNFTQLNTQFGIDHTAFNPGSGNGDGFHKKVTYNVPQSVDPTPAGVASVLYTKSVSGLGQLFFANSSVVTRLTGATTTGTSGSTFLPGGIIMKWGTVTLPGTGFNQPVSWTATGGNFPTAFFAVVASSAQSTSVTLSCATAFSTSGFTAIKSSSSGTLIISYIAIGH